VSQGRAVSECAGGIRGKPEKIRKKGILDYLP